MLFLQNKKFNRVEGARNLLAELDSVKSTWLSYVLTSDESWFFHDNPHQAKCASCRDEARRDRDKHSPKRRHSLWSSGPSQGSPM